MEFGIHQPLKTFDSKRMAKGYYEKLYLETGKE